MWRKDLSWKSSVGFCLCFRLALFHSASYFFFLYWSLHFIHGFWGYLGYNRWASLDQVICRSILYWWNWYTSELCYSVSILNDVIQLINFPTRIPDCDSYSPALLDLFISSGANICSTVAFPPFWSNCLRLFSCGFEWSSWSIIRCFLDDIFKICAFPADTEYCEWIKVGIDVHIPHH